MRLRSQLLISVTATALVCGVAGTIVVERRATDAGNRLLDSELQTGESALQRQWSLRRAERRSVYQGIAGQTYFRAYLQAGDREQMGYFAASARRAGGDSAAVTDRAGQVLATDGPNATALAELVREKNLGAEGELIALGGAPADVYRLPVGTETAVGYLLVSNSIDGERLSGDSRPFGVEAAVGVDGTFIDTLPVSVSPAAQSQLTGDGTQREIGTGADRYRIRSAPFGRGRVLVAVPLVRVNALTSEAALSVAVLLGLVLVVSLGGALLVTRPIEQLRRAADRLGSGDIAASATTLTTFLSRKDEVGALARAYASAAAQLGETATSSAALGRAVDRAIAALDRSAGAVATGAERQEKRLREVQSVFGPLIEALEQSTTGLTEAQGFARTLSQVASAVEKGISAAGGAAARAGWILDGGLQRFPRDRSPESREAHRILSEVGVQLATLNRLLEEQRELLPRVSEAAGSIRRRLDDTLAIRIRERDRGGAAQRAVSEIGRVAGAHVEEAAALRHAAEGLREDTHRLQRTLAVLDELGQVQLRPDSPPPEDEALPRFRA